MIATKSDTHTHTHTHTERHAMYDTSIAMLAAEENARGWSAAPIGTPLDLILARTEPFDGDRTRTYLHTDQGVFATLNAQIADRVSSYKAVCAVDESGIFNPPLRVVRTERTLDNGRRVTGIAVAVKESVND